MTDRSMNSAGSQWWKAWVLLTGLGATVFGWMAFPQGEKEPLVRVEPVESARQLPTRVHTLRAIPQKPVFRTPVARTRRS